MHPKGNIPATKAEGTVFKYVGWFGICLSNKLVLVGADENKTVLFVNGSLRARTDPKTLEGRERSIQIPTSMHREENGKASEECTQSKNTFRKMMTRKTVAGIKLDVRIMLDFHWTPPKNLKTVIEVKAPIKANNAYNMMATVGNAPLF